MAWLPPELCMLQLPDPLAAADLRALRRIIFACRLLSSIS